MTDLYFKLIIIRLNSIKPQPLCLPSRTVLIYWSSYNIHKHSLLRLAQPVDFITVHKFTPSVRLAFSRYLYFTYKLFLPNPNLLSLYQILFSDIPLGDINYLGCEWSPSYKLLELLLLKFGAKVFGLPHSLFFPTNNYIYAQNHMYVSGESSQVVCRKLLSSKSSSCQILPDFVSPGSFKYSDDRQNIKNLVVCLSLRSFSDFLLESLMLLLVYCRFRKTYDISISHHPSPSFFQSFLIFAAKFMRFQLIPPVSSLSFPLPYTFFIFSNISSLALDFLNNRHPFAIYIPFSHARLSPYLLCQSIIFRNGSSLESILSDFCSGKLTPFYSNLYKYLGQPLVP